MDEFDHRGERDARCARVSARPSKKKQKRWSQTLATGADDVFGDLIDKGDLRAKALANLTIEGLHFGPDRSQNQPRIVGRIQGNCAFAQ
jgi:hypothetical protein